MPEETILHKHCVLYLETFRRCRAQNVSAYYCHKRADAEAERAYHLTPEEKKRRDAWLDTKPEFQGWKREPPEDRGRSLFDGDDSILRAE